MESRKRGLLFAFAQTRLNLTHDIGICDLRGTIRHRLAQRRTRVVPVATARRIGIEIRERSLERTQRVLKHRDILAGLNNTERDAGRLDAAYRLRTHARCRSEHDRTRHTPRRQELAEACVLLILLIGHCLLSVHLAVHERVPPIGQIARQLIAHGRNVHRDGAGHNEQPRITPHPQLMDDRRHQAEHTTCPLKALECRPVLVEAVEHLRMNRIAGDHALPIRHLAHLLLIRMIHLAERLADAISAIRIFAVEEETAAHNLKALVCRHRLPDRLHTPKCMRNAVERHLPRRTADLDLGLRNRRNHEAVLARTRSLRYLLDKGDKVIKRSCGQPLHAIDLLRIGDQLIHEDEAWPRRVKEILQCLRAWRYPPLLSASFT